MATDRRVAEHYSHGRLGDAILAALREAGVDVDSLSPGDLAPIDHFHGRGLAATRALAAGLRLAADMRVLDIGCGIGGPARYIASEYGCRVTGIDLTAEFCRVADMLTRRTGLVDRVEIHQASALDLPFENAVFDAAYSHNVVMNIEDRVGFFAEAFRTLRRGGRFAIAQVCQGPGGPALYPVPWATEPSTSFLSTLDETRQVLEETGFEIVSVHDSTAASRENYRLARERVREHGPPVLGIHIILGKRFKDMARNGARNVEEGRTIPIEIVCRKP